MKISVVSFGARSRTPNLKVQKTNQTPIPKTISFKANGFYSMEEFQKSLREIETSQINQRLYKHSDLFQDLRLLKQTNLNDRHAQKYASAIETIRTIGKEKLTSTDFPKEINSPNPTVWSITSEFAPIKEGGLGSVPPEIRNNAERLGVNMPTFIPMYLQQGKSTLLKQEDEYRYIYNDKTMPLKKMATVKIDTYQDGKVKSTPVNYFLFEDKDNQNTKRQLVFMQVDDYFDGTIYEANAKTDENEKFAVMSKAVYEFAKIKMDGIKASKDVEIIDKKAFLSIKEPDAMILNDWQASPTAALMRYKAVMENAHKELSDETAQKLKDMNIITIGHNVMYQGSSQNNNDYNQKKSTTSNILNTLFDKYTHDIVSNAQSGASSIDPKDRGLKVLDNVLVMNPYDKADNYTNFLNMGIILSDYFCPVSKNYAQELISPNHRDLSNSLQWALVQKDKAGKLVGVINGNDFDNLSIEAKAKQIKKTTGLDFKTYSKSTKLDEIIKKRQKNKMLMYKDFILPFSDSSVSNPQQKAKVAEVTSKLEFVEGSKGTNLPILTDEEILNTPILMSGGRLASQKGIDVLCDAIKILFENWNKDFPNQNKPIFYLAGSDQENGVQRKIIEDLKGNLSKENNDRILFAHGFAPMAAMMAASDFFLMPSKFEPCGLTQGESLALATPVIASAVGGIVDTINRDDKFNGILTKKDKPLTAQGYYEAIKEGLDIYFNDKPKYNQMIQNSISEDYSWAKDGKGSVFDYFELLGIRK